MTFRCVRCLTGIPVTASNTTRCPKRLSANNIIPTDPDPPIVARVARLTFYLNGDSVHLADDEALVSFWAPPVTERELCNGDFVVCLAYSGTSTVFYTGSFFSGDCIGYLSVAAMSYFCVRNRFH